MALREIRLIGDEMLTKPCREVKEITPRLAELIEDMLETMYEADGIGLAAPQVGVLRRIVIIDIWQPGVEEAEEKQLGDDAAEADEDAVETEAETEEQPSDENSTDTEAGTEGQPSGEDTAEDGEEEVDEEDKGPLIMINPVITHTEGEQTGDEGCLSLPGKVGTVTRPNLVTVTYFDENMEEYELEADGLLARAICHEVDHLEGHTYVEFVEGEIREAGHSDSDEDEDDEAAGEDSETEHSSEEGKDGETGQSSGEEKSNEIGEGG